MQILVTGTSSGLGRYVLQQFQGRPFLRGHSLSAYRSILFDAIIHCAFNPQRDPSNLSSYFEDNTSLTHHLLSLPHRKFVYISTVDVYPRDGALHHETSVVDTSSLQSNYGLSKILSEEAVRAQCPNHLILRPTGLIGDHIRPTTLTRLLTEKKPDLSLTADSWLNFVTHEILGELIRMALKDDVTGTLNVAAGANATLGELAEIVGAAPRFGAYRYDIGRAECSVARSMVPAFATDTAANVAAFAASFRSGLIRTLDPR